MTPAPVAMGPTAGSGTPSSGTRRRWPVSPRPGTHGLSRWTNSDRLTLLGFLSSGCATCVAFWEALQAPGAMELPEGIRVVIVTKGPDREVPAEVRARTTGSVPVVMSTEAWLDYQVPGSPFFVLVDGATGRKVGQGVASTVAQLAELVRRAEHDRGPGSARRRPRPGLARRPGARGGGRRRAPRRGNPSG